MTRPKPAEQLRPTVRLRLDPHLVRGFVCNGRLARLTQAYWRHRQRELAAVEAARQEVS